MLQYSDERRNLIGSWDMKAPFLRVANNGVVSPKGGNISKGATGKEKASMKREIVVEAMFPIKLLLRITSKKFNGRYLSFYFKLPTLDRLKMLNSNHTLTLSQNNSQEIGNLPKKDDYTKIIKDISENKDPSVRIFFKTKILIY